MINIIISFPADFRLWTESILIFNGFLIRFDIFFN